MRCILSVIRANHIHIHLDHYWVNFYVGIFSQSRSTVAHIAMRLQHGSFALICYGGERVCCSRALASIASRTSVFVIIPIYGMRAISCWKRASHLIDCLCCLIWPHGILWHADLTEPLVTSRAAHLIGRWSMPARIACASWLAITAITSRAQWRMILMHIKNH